MRTEKELEDRKKIYLKSYCQTKLSAKIIEVEIAMLQSEKNKAYYSDADRLLIKEWIMREKEMCDKLIKTHINIVDKIELMSDPTEKNLLRLKYIHGMTWEEVSDEIGYSYRQIHNIHKRALQNFNINI